MKFEENTEIKYKNTIIDIISFLKQLNIDIQNKQSIETLSIVNKINMLKYIIQGDKYENNQ
jgi:hypothetical protein